MTPLERLRLRITGLYVRRVEHRLPWVRRRREAEANESMRDYWGAGARVGRPAERGDD